MILVAGATGVLGGMIARRLLEQGRDVRVLARPNSQYQSLEEAGAEVVFGDLKDRASLDAALRGVRTVITTANSAVRGGDDTPETVERQGNRNLIDAAKEAEVEHFIFVSALGASPDSPMDFMRGKAETEQYLRESGVPFTILSPNIFMETWIGLVVGSALQHDQPVTLVGEGQRKHSFVSDRDVAEFAVAAVENPAAHSQILVIGGPEALSWTEVVKACGRALGREIPVRRIALGSSIPGAPEIVTQFLNAMDTYDSPVQMGELARSYGVTLTPVEEFARRTFGMAAG